ncbi:sugar phosphate isomerase/epimerase [Pullulanibacillus sp. KACC 23026]|uniref:sugar phosphate isomerase/epimerase family protein n=1 Tax=Pullulanibacillus sp. KACC 23026 TaxID=3028315 RepID=UPI0023AEE982|nr:sugar phosphate isomerase/epimerase family protein [Pullulanibacillus sp. KACC 23026]WEG13157.1 sugar phosphate isomerase/epimerase [Pullulanibacillus sp. KACC 23026]
MKLGLSTYSLLRAMQSGEMTVLDVIQWVKEQGGEHVEIVPLGYDLVETPELIRQIKEKAAEQGLSLSNYAISASFIQEDRSEFEAEIERVKEHVDIAAELGVSRMRHDVGFLSPKEAGLARFEKDLPQIIEACQRIADYAAPKGITTSIENHGFYVQSSERVQRVIEGVNRPNFKTTLDVGNFLCVDEDPLVAVKKNLPYASIVHLKDFYYRKDGVDRRDGWFKTANGNLLRGAIVGHGDLPMVEIIKAVKEFGYDGDISIEFEGMEECRQASKMGMDLAHALWDSI